MPLQTPTTVDPRDGRYYVSVVDGKRFTLLLGPFQRHQDALNRVDECYQLACKLNSWAHFYAYGTVRMDDNFTLAGKFNDLLKYKPPDYTIGSAQIKNNKKASRKK